MPLSVSPCPLPPLSHPPRDRNTTAESLAQAAERERDRAGGVNLSAYSAFPNQVETFPRSDSDRARAQVTGQTHLLRRALSMSPTD